MDMNYEDKIKVILIILAIGGIGYFVYDDVIVIDDGKNTTLNISEIPDNTTYEELINLISENLTLKNLDLNLLLKCREGSYEFNDALFEIYQYTTYEVCIVGIEGENLNEKYIYNLQIDRDFEEYIRKYDRLEEMRNNSYKYNITNTTYEWRPRVNNKYIEEYYDTGKKKSLFGIIEELEINVCEKYTNWEQWNNEMNYENEFVYNTLKERCEYEV